MTVTDVSWTTLVAPLRAVNWSSLEDVWLATEQVLRAVASDSGTLRDLLESTSRDPHLLALCEHYDILDKVVLHDDASGFRLRLHVFLPGYFDRPHNHRWTYSSLILRGSYKHTIYQQAVDLSPGIDVGGLQPSLLRTEREGSFYSLNHTAIHSVVAEPYTISLIARGPAATDRFLVMDRVTNKAWWQYGASQESEQDRLAKAMSREHFSALMDRLRTLNVI